MKVQGTSICFNGHGYLIKGKSGSGKSSLALKMINCGARLISDDITEIENGNLIAPQKNKGWLEVRGIWLISGFLVCDQAPLSAILELTDEKTERIPEDKTDEIPLFYIWGKDLTSIDKILIIDAKYYSKTTQSYYDTKTIHSHNLYQIFTYVKNKAVAGGEVSGILLYARTDEEIQPDNEYMMSGNKISVKTLDLNRDFTEIAAQLNKIADEFLSN